MEYLIDTYVFRYLPFTVHPSTRKNIISGVMQVIVVADWLCKTRELEPFVNNHASLLLAELCYVMFWSFTLCHALRVGSRYIYTWTGIHLLAFFAESIRFIDKSMDFVWYTQTMLTFMGMRIPLYVLFGIYHAIFYTAHVMVERLCLNWWGEATANGLVVLMLSFPLQVVGTKLLWWQWHDSDPRLSDAFCSVPLVVLALYAMLAVSFNVSLYLFRKRFLQKRYDWKRFVAEFFCVVGAALLALCFTAVQYIVFFYVLHDVFQIHSAYEVVLLLIVYSGVTLKAVFSPRVQDSFYRTVRSERSTEMRSKEGPREVLDELTILVVIHFLFHLMATIFSSPLDIVSVGVHQAIGPCDALERIFSPFGQSLYRKKYFCVEDHHEKLFDFHCIPGGQVPSMQDNEPLEYYAVCGRKSENRPEYISMMGIYCLTAFFVMHYTALWIPKMVRKPEAYENEDYGQRHTGFGFAARKPANENRSGSDGLSGRTDDETPQLRHRPRVSNSGSTSAKSSRLPTPTRLSGRPVKSPT